MARKTISQKEVRRFAHDFVRHLQNTHRLPVEAAYLFGSFAKGSPQNWSDIDVCVVSKKFRRVDPLEYLWTRRRDTDVERGIEPYGIAPEDFVDENPVAYEVRKHGILL